MLLLLVLLVLLLLLHQPCTRPPTQPNVMQCHGWVTTPFISPTPLTVHTTGCALTKNRLVVGASTQVASSVGICPAMVAAGPAQPRKRADARVVCKLRAALEDAHRAPSGPSPSLRYDCFTGLGALDRPFGYGVRSCIGVEVGRNDFSYVLLDHALRSNRTAN